MAAPTAMRRLLHKMMNETNFEGGDDSDPLPTTDWIIEGRFLPNSSIYENGAIRVEITIPHDYPATPPVIRLKTNIYHPNVDRNGLLCIPSLASTASYLPSMTLVSIIEEATRIIDEPSVDLIQHAEAAAMYSTDRKRYEEIAKETYRRNPVSRD